MSQHASTAAVAIPAGPVVVTSTIEVAGAGQHLTDVDLVVDITHTFSADLDITLQSPAGTVSTITTDNGAGNDNTFAGTTFDDQADPDGQVPYTTNPGLVTDHLYADGTAATPLVPEEAMAAFAGEDPNGTWTLTISDDLASDSGTLNSWRLDVDAASPAGPSPDAVGCWHLDETSGTTAHDASGHGNDGTYVNGPVLGVAGVLGTAVSMDGRDDHVRVPDAPSLHTGDSFSLVGWVRRDEDGRAHQLFNKGGKSFHLVVMSRFEGNQVWLRKAGVSTIVRSDGGVPADGAWHQVAATKDGPHTAQLYIDGVPQDEQVVSGAQVIQDTTFPLYFSATPSGNVVAGDLDEFAVYGRPLSAGEVAAGYSAGAPAAPAAARAGAARTTARRSIAKRPDRARRTAKRGATRTLSATDCGDAGTSTSGITAIEVTGIPCTVAAAAAFAGPQAVKALGLSCAITGEDFGSAVTRITHSCTGPGLRLRYTSLS